MYYDDATGDIGYKATNYTLHGKNIVHLSDGSNNLHFFYDAQNKPAVVIFNGTAYAYLYNLQGDVIGLVDSNGTKMVSYTYDAWGKPITKTGTLASTLGTIQPFRYRGYVYDEETELYYLRSRYYNPMQERFVNADSINREFIVRRVDNCFAYCNNCPTMYADPNGTVGQGFDLGQGWHWRIDPASSNGKVQRHIHIWKDGGDSFAQNEDGSVHDGLSGNPPKWIQKKLKELKKWKWKNGEDVPSQPTPPPSNKSTPRPSPSPNPTPAPGPAPVVVPVPDEQTSEGQAYSSANGLTVADALAGIGIGGFIYFAIKLLAAIPSGGWSLAIP